MDAMGLLLLQIEWGADEALDEAPLDRLTPAVTASSPLLRKPVTARAPAVENTPAERALQAAARADTLPALREAIAGFDGCPLRDMATNLVFASGDPDSGVLLVGGAPGADEDRAGTPFAGREGALLDQMLASVNLTRESLLLTPLIPWRPPGGRVPTPGEIQLCRPFLARLLTLTRPRRLVLFGTLPANTLLGAGPRPRKIDWTEASVEGHISAVLLVPALADLLKTPSRRKDAWAGMRALRRAMEE